MAYLISHFIDKKFNRQWRFFPDKRKYDDHKKRKKNHMKKNLLCLGKYYLSVKCLIYEMSSLWNVPSIKSMKCPSMKYLSMKCLSMKFSKRTIFFVNDGVVQKNNQTMKKRIGSIRQIEELTYFRKQQMKKQTN